MNHDPTSQAPNHNLLAKGVLFLGGGLALAGVLHPTDARADSPDPISISIDVNTPLPAPEITLPDTNPGSPSPDAPAAGNPDPGLGNPSPAPADSRNNQPAAPSAETVLPDVSAPLPAPEVALPINPVQKYIPKPQDVLPQALPAPVVVVPPVPQQPISGTPVMPTVPYSPDNPGNNQAPSSPAAPGNTESDPYAGKITTSAPPTLTGPKPPTVPKPEAVNETWHEIINPNEYKCTTKFEMRWGQMHWGVDLAAPLGTPFKALRKGVVIESGPASGFGNWIVVDSGNGQYDIYGHMFKNGLLVKVGDTVAGGQIIGKIGEAGQSTGPHLHFEIRLNNLSTNAKRLNPETEMQQHGITLCP